MVSTAPNRLPSLMFVLTRDGSREALDRWLREFYGDPQALTLEDLAGVVADFDMLLAGPVDKSVKESVQRLRDAFASTTLPPHPLGEFDDESPTNEYELPPFTPPNPRLVTRAE